MLTPPEKLPARSVKQQKQEESMPRLFLILIGTVLVLGTLATQNSWLMSFKVEAAIEKMKVIDHRDINISNTNAVVRPEPKAEPQTKIGGETLKEAQEAVESTSTTQAPENATTLTSATVMKKPRMETSLSIYETFDGPFCQPWDTDMDQWWNSHPTWELDQAGENATHQCFQPMANLKMAEMIEQIHRVQFVEGDCNKTITKIMWSSGYGADSDNVVDGLWYAFHKKEPVQMANNPWHYADNSVKKALKQTPETLKIACPKRNMYCYFLETCKCQATEERKKWKNGFLKPMNIGKNTEYPWIARFATRQRTWLRKLVSDFIRQQKSHFATPCTAIHVRRGDVILHGKYARKYHPIEEYLEFAQNKSVIVHNNILLLTDDANAIPEAKTKFPQYNWMAIDRPRTPSNEAKWEQHLASNDPIFEMVVMQASFRMVQMCDHIIHTQSSFGHTLANQMKLTGRNFTQLNMDEGRSDIRNENYTATQNVSRAYNRRF